MNATNLTADGQNCFWIMNAGWWEWTLTLEFRLDDLDLQPQLVHEDIQALWDIPPADDCLLYVYLLTRYLWINGFGAGFFKEAVHSQFKDGNQVVIQGLRDHVILPFMSSCKIHYDSPDGGKFSTVAMLVLDSYNKSGSGLACTFCPFDRYLNRREKSCWEFSSPPVFPM